MVVVPEVSELRGGEISLPDAGNDDTTRKAALGRMELEELSVEIELRWQAKPVHLKLTDGTQEIFAFAYDPARGRQELQVGEGSHPVSLPSTDNGMHEARIFLDASVAECFVDGRVAWTTRTYHVPREKLRIEIPEEELGAVRTLKAWPLRPISADRLTS
jgi:hypothetical protein